LTDQLATGLRVIEANDLWFGQIEIRLAVACRGQALNFCCVVFRQQTEKQQPADIMQ